MCSIEKKKETVGQECANPMYPQQQEHNSGKPTDKQVKEAVKKLHPDELSMEGRG